MTEEKLDKGKELLSKIRDYELVLKRRIDGIGYFGEYNNNIIKVDEYMILKFKDIIRERLEELKKEFEEL